ncbi:MAG TPA: hypothetical protein VK272_08905 [Solirubrobacteraceae bacterium]|nr:hypothetical protein [Solirubrobacteraceae bacterium]
MSFAMPRLLAAATTLTLQGKSLAAGHPHHATHVSTLAIVLAAAAAVALFVCAVWGVARMLAFEPRWTLSLRHAVAEAGFRASATWAELGDWMRLGR